MGSPSGHPCERPVHEVWVDAFGIATTPVTNDEYAAYLRATAAPPPAFWHDPAFAAPRPRGIREARPPATGASAGAAPGGTPIPGAPSRTAPRCRRTCATPTTG